MVGYSRLAGADEERTQQEQIGVIVLAAPDIDLDVFRSDMSRFPGNHKPDEHIEVIEIPFGEALAMIERGAIADAKTIALLYYARSKGLMGEERRANDLRQYGASWRRRRFRSRKMPFDCAGGPVERVSRRFATNNRTFIVDPKREAIV